MKRYRMTIAYDGTAYNGWQRQPEPARTVQREIEKAAGSVVSHPVTINGSSRTDTGVHALGQCAIMQSETRLEPEVLRRAINSRLPDDILIRTLDLAPTHFDVFTPISKRYRYLIWADRDRPVLNRQYVYHYYQPLDIPAMQAACAHFVGTHDFDAFKGRSDERDNTVRTIHHCHIHRRGPGGGLTGGAERGVGGSPLVVFAVEGSGFLYHMVRTMVGTVLEVGRGHWKPERVAEVIASKDRQQAGPTSPAQGLCLQWIKYDPQLELPNNASPT
jgi:tRNA pseudouridine38-40 synthase